MRERLGRHLNLTARIYVKKFNERIADSGLYHSQWPVIVRLYEHGESTQTELSRFLAVEPPTMTRTLARMEAAGWIRRKSGNDHRERRICLTARAVEMFAYWDEIANEVEEQAVKDISPEDYAAFRRVVERILHNLHDEDRGEK